MAKYRAERLTNTIKRKQCMSKPIEILYMVPKHREKKHDRKRKNLIRLGIPQGQAYAWSRTRNEARIHEYK